MVLERVTQSELFRFVPEVRRISYIFILALFATRFIRLAEKNFLAKAGTASDWDATTADALAKLSRLSVVITAVLIALQSM